jgi:FKBP-type peptidyl-prolyl cis-trans isomerase FklB
MLKILIAAVLTVSICFMTSVVLAKGDIRLDSEKKKYSYAVGTKIAQQLLEKFGQEEADMDLKAFRKGIDVILAGQKPQLTEEEANAILQKQQQNQMAEAAKLAKKRLSVGKEFLKKNKGVKGVKETKSGIQYTVISKGKAKGKHPTVHDTVVVHYQGTLIDGTVFDSSYKRGEPATFPLGKVIPGWTEIVQLMKPGDKWAVVIPSELAYGENGAGGTIGPNETLLFDIELIEVKK